MYNDDKRWCPYLIFWTVAFIVWMLRWMNDQTWFAFGSELEVNIGNCQLHDQRAYSINQVPPKPSKTIERVDDCQPFLAIINSGYPLNKKCRNRWNSGRWWSITSSCTLKTCASLRQGGIDCGIVLLALALLSTMAWVTDRIMHKYLAWESTRRC